MSRDPNYYEFLKKVAPAVSNKNAIKVWFESTETEEQPTHGKVLDKIKLKGILNGMAAKILADLTRNSRKAWRTSLVPPIKVQKRNTTNQPLDIEYF